MADFFLNMAETLSVWRVSQGWQTEIALWNVGIDIGLLITLIKQNIEYAKILPLFRFFFAFYWEGTILFMHLQQLTVISPFIGLGQLRCYLQREEQVLFPLLNLTALKSCKILTLQNLHNIKHIAYLAETLTISIELVVFLCRN